VHASCCAHSQCSDEPLRITEVPGHISPAGSWIMCWFSCVPVSLPCDFTRFSCCLGVASGYWLARSLLICFGICFVALRVIKWVRLFWWLWIAFGIASFMSLFLLLDISCSCTSYFQCLLLSQFSPLGDVEFVNKYMVPPDTVTCSDGTKCVSPWGQVHFDHLPPPPKDSAVSPNSLLQFSHTSYDSQIRAHVQRSNATHTNASQPNDDWEEKLEASLIPVLSKFKKTHNDVVWKGEERKKRTLGTIDSVEDENQVKKMLDYLRCAVGTGDKSSCPPPPPPDTKAHRQEIMKFMWLCYEDYSCKAMRITMVRNFKTNPNTIQLRIYFNKGKVVLPQLKNEVQQLNSEIDGVSLHKYWTPASKADQASMPLEVREQLPESELQAIIFDEYKSQCRCSQTLSASGCAVYYDDGQPRFWCFIENITLEHCFRAGYKVHKVGPRYWTEDICDDNQKNTEQCSCSGWGLPHL